VLALVLARVEVAGGQQRPGTVVFRCLQMRIDDSDAPHAVGEREALKSLARDAVELAQPRAR
jgi:hypothetical protein